MEGKYILLLHNWEQNLLIEQEKKKKKSSKKWFWKILNKLKLINL